MFLLFTYLVIWTKVAVFADDSNDPADYYYYYNANYSDITEYKDIVNCTELCGSKEVIYINPELYKRSISLTIRQLGTIYF